MATASPNPAATAAPPVKSGPGSIVVPKMTEPNAGTSTNLSQEQTTGSNENDVWTTERQLVSSLAKLQNLEAMVRTYIQHTCICTFFFLFFSFPLVHRLIDPDPKHAYAPPGTSFRANDTNSQSAGDCAWKAHAQITTGSLRAPLKDDT